MKSNDTVTNQNSPREVPGSPSPAQPDTANAAVPPKTKPKRPVTVRLTPALLEGCHEIEKLCFHTPWSAESLKLLTGNIGTGYAVLDSRGNVAAYGGMLYTVDEGQITNIGVREEYRRLGFGRAITRALLNDAWQHKLDRVTLEVRASNTAALALYRSLGFTEVGKRPHFYSFPDETAILLSISG